MGTIFYWTGGLVALLCFVRAGTIVVNPAASGHLAVLLWCASAVAAWGCGRAALFVLARR